LVRFTPNIATEQFVAHLVIDRTGEVVGKFSYPARPDYELLEKVGDAYTGKITASMWLNHSSEKVRVEVKPFIDADTAPIGAKQVRRIANNTLKLIERVKNGNFV
jgi:hypothetical protein